MSAVPVRQKPSPNSFTDEEHETALSKIMNDLQGHLDALAQNPQLGQDTALLAFTKTALTTPALRAHLSIGQAAEVVQKLYALLAQLPDPSDELFQLLDALLKDFSLGQIMTLSPDVDLAAGLTIGADRYNSLVLNLLADADTKSVRRLATNFGNVFEALVRLFLSSQDIGISSKACDVLLQFLKEGNGEVAKRFFRDDDIYGAIFEICDSRRPSADLNRTQRSIAQTRLLDFVASLAAWNWDTAVKSHNPVVESAYGLKTGEGLLDFATRYQADFEDDVLLHRSLLDVLQNLLIVQATKSWSGEQSPALEFLLSRKLHQSSIKYFLTPRDPSISSVDLSLLSSGSAHYAATFLSSHPQFFAENERIVEMFVRRLDNLNTSTVTSETLHVLASIPRGVHHLFPRMVTQFSISGGNANVITALARVLAGPAKVEEQFPVVRNSQLLDLPSERAAARKLFHKYQNLHPRLFNDLITVANRTALPVPALAALNFIVSIVDAEWDSPHAGFDAIFTDVRNRDAVMTYIRGFPNRPQGTAIGRDDEQYRIAEARFALLKRALSSLESIEAPEAQHDLWRTRLRDRVRLGIWGPSGTQIASEGL